MAKTVHMMLSEFSMNRVPPTSTAAPLGSASRTASTSTVSPSSICATGKPISSSSSPFNQGRTEPYALGDGYGHIALVVDDLDAEHAASKEGLQPKPIKEFIRDGALMARFFFVEDPDGYKIEVLQKHGRYR